VFANGIPSDRRGKNRAASQDVFDHDAFDLIDFDMYSSLSKSVYKVHDSHRYTSEITEPL
jgi:hypothetical protein